MKFVLNEEQLAFAEAVEALLAAECTPAALRSVWDGTSSMESLWSALVEMGVTTAVTGEEAGGLGMSLVDVIGVIEAAGYAGLPLPLAESIAAAQLGGSWVDERLVAGEGLAVAGQQGAVSSFPCVHFVLVERDGAVQAVELTGTEPRVESVDGARRLVQFDGESAGEEIGLASALVPGLHTAMAAELVGLSQRMVDITVEYVKERHQFNVPIGSFQAIKHHLANAGMAVEFARPLARRAAWSISREEAEADLFAEMALSQAALAAQRVAKLSLQCHGAIGYTTECDLHLYMKRAWALAREHRAGDSLRKVASHLLM